MRKKTAMELGLIAVMAVALVFGIVSLLPKKKNEPKAVPGVALSKPPAKGLSKPMDFLAPVIKIKTMKDDTFYVKLCRIADALPLERDPFSFIWTGPKSSRDGLDLTGILWDDKKPTAVINDIFYGVGDSTNQFTVTAIREDKVLLKDSQGDFELHLKS